MKTILSEAGQVPISKQIEDIVMSTPVVDVHTHLYDPVFKDLLLWGIDELLVYHYLIAEVFRRLEKPYDEFWSLPKQRQAELVWQHLFIEHSPISEACRGVLTVLHAFGLDPRKKDLPALRNWFSEQDAESHVTRCMELAGVKKIYMTNSPFDDLERPMWEKGFRRDERFAAALRIDPLLLAWKDTAPKLATWGYKVDTDPARGSSCDEVRRFLGDWSRRLKASYVMVSLPADFKFPAATDASLLIERAVLPHCLEHGMPLALMPGVRRAVNPQLRLAGDGCGLSDLTALQNLCAGFSENRFLATVLARENQHELCVLARKFRNLHIFGCWWFTNVPSLVDEMTRMRLELLGLSFTPQHSDARVLDQIVYKWPHSRKVIAAALTEKFAGLAQAGWHVTRAEVERDVAELFGAGFEAFCRRA